MTHSEPPFVQGELKQLFKERNRARKLWQFTKFHQHKTEFKIKLKEKSDFTDNRYGRITLLPWMPKTAPFGEPLEHSGKRPPRFPPLMAPTASLSVTQTKPN
ncbi:hypothetical protein TNCV_3418101 [Trichonephila clavipes]|nr:hypothetical protein TNCV_3418101 [Trichonephila clavipes]